MSDQKQQTATVSVDLLKDLIAAIKAPPAPTEQQLAEQEQDRRDRAATASLQLEKMNRDQINRMACTHRRKDRTTTMVYEYMGGYLICQQCQAIVHPGVRPSGDAGKETANHFYDTRLFNEHFVETQAGMTTF